MWFYGWYHPNLDICKFCKILLQNLSSTLYIIWLNLLYLVLLCHLIQTGHIHLNNHFASIKYTLLYSYLKQYDWDSQTARLTHCPSGCHVVMRWQRSRKMRTRITAVWLVLTLAFNTQTDTYFDDRHKLWQKMWCYSLTHWDNTRTFQNSW